GDREDRVVAVEHVGLLPERLADGVVLAAGITGVSRLAGGVRPRFVRSPAVTVSARSVNFSPSSDTTVLAGTYPFEADDLVADWHTHELHQVEYARAGVVEVETAAAHYLLPSQQAVWIPAGLAHRTTLRRVRTVSVFFAPELVPDAPPEARVLAAAPVIREMIVYGTRWPIMRTTSDPVADTFFLALANLVTDWLDHETPLCLPTSRDPLVAAAMEYTNAHLAEVRAQDVGR